MENQKRRNVTIRLTDEEIELFDELRHLRAKLAGCPISRSSILMEALEYGYLTVLENVTATAQNLAESWHSENHA
tara:strand:- start:504 stop:728 length:225 start_codon:yes stop_codon:yes gene_type:complete